MPTAPGCSSRRVPATADRLTVSPVGTRSPRARHEPARRVPIEPQEVRRAAPVRSPSCDARPAARCDGRPAANKLRVPISAYVVDCAVYVDGDRLPGRWTHDARSPRCASAATRLRLDRAARAGRGADHRHRRRVRAARAGRRGRGARPPAAQAGALRRHAVHGAQDRPLPRARRSRPPSNEIVETGEIMAFLGTDFVMTVRHGEHSGAAQRPPQAGGRPGAAGARPGRRAARHRRPRRGQLPRRHRGDRGRHRRDGDPGVRPAQSTSTPSRST